MDHKFSVIIPTLHRKKSLIRLLMSLESEIKQILEIIIVEQDENNMKLILDESRKLKLPTKYLFMKEISTTKAKNFGIDLSAGKFLLFLDDDVVVKSGLLEAHGSALLREQTGAVCGRSLSIGQRVEPDRSDVGRISNLAIFSDGYSSTISQEIDTVIGCNASWNRNVLKKIGGFDEKFTGNALREESDLSLRAVRAGYKVIFEPTALVYHLREPIGGARKANNRLVWYYHFFSNEVYFFLKHRNHVLFPLFLLTRINWILRCMFGFGREVSLKSVLTPIRGILDGISKYRN